jgi:hypothetical protein
MGVGIGPLYPNELVALCHFLGVTVRMITGRDSGTDRTSMKHLVRIDPERAKAIEWRSRKRQRDALPKMTVKFLDEGAALIKAAKALGG